MIEHWRDVIGYEDSYQVSSIGRVRTKARTVTRVRNGIPHQLPKRAQFLALHPNPQDYLVAKLSKGGEQVTRTVHRLVALAFIPNPEDLPEINHLNGVKTDNISSPTGIRNAMLGGWRHAGLEFTYEEKRRAG